jgi:hypothetical protein
VMVVTQPGGGEQWRCLDWRTWHTWLSPPAELRGAHGIDLEAHQAPHGKHSQSL